MRMLEHILGELDDTVTLTPDVVVKNIVADTVELYKDNSEFRVLHIGSTSGIFAKTMYNELMKSQTLLSEFKSEEELSDHILTSQIFVLAQDEFCAALTRRMLYGDMHIKGNVIYFEDIGTALSKLSDIRFEELVMNAFHRDREFDVIMGNPVYQINGNAMYHKWLEKAMFMNPDRIVQMLPAEWAYSTSDEVSKVRKKIRDSHMLKKVHIIESMGVYDKQCMLSSAGCKYPVDVGDVRCIVLDRDNERKNEGIIVDRCEVLSERTFAVVDKCVRSFDEYLDIELEIKKLRNSVA